MASKRYESAKSVVASKSAGKLEGVLLDLFSASALVKLYEALSPANQERFDSLPLGRLVSLAMGGK
jgi:hypothetical protein